MSDALKEIIERQEGYGPFVAFSPDGPLAPGADGRAGYMNAVEILAHACNDIPDAVVSKRTLRSICTGMLVGIGYPQTTAKKTVDAMLDVGAA